MGERTQPKFLNVDLDLCSSRRLDALIRGLAPAMFVLDSRRRMSPFGGRRVHSGYWAILETAAQHARASSCIRAIVRAVTSLPPELRKEWDRIGWRDICIGYDQVSRERMVKVNLSAATVRLASSIGCSVSLVVYNEHDAPRKSGIR